MASDLFTGTQGDLVSPWTGIDGSSIAWEKDGSGNARINHANRWQGQKGVGYTSGDPAVSEIVGVDATTGTYKLHVHATDLIKGYNTSYTLSGSDISTFRINREDTSSVASATGLAVDATNVDMGMTSEPEAGGKRIKLFLNQVEVLSWLDPSGTALADGDRSGFSANAAGVTNGVGTEITEWRDVIGGAATPPAIDFTFDSTITLTPTFGITLGTPGAIVLDLDATIDVTPIFGITLGGAPALPIELPFNFWVNLIPTMDITLGTPSVPIVFDFDSTINVTSAFSMNLAGGPITLDLNSTISVTPSFGIVYNGPITLDLDSRIYFYPKFFRSTFVNDEATKVTFHKRGFVPAFERYS